MGNYHARFLGGNGAVRLLTHPMPHTEHKQEKGLCNNGKTHLPLVGCIYI
jgi:hypothetical protein